MRFKEVRQLIIDRTGFTLSATELSKYYQDEGGSFHMLYGVKHYDPVAIDNICERLKRDGRVVRGTIECDDSEDGMMEEIEARKAELLPIYRKRHEEARRRQLEASGEAGYTIPEVKMMPRRKGFVTSFGAS